MTNTKRRNAILFSLFAFLGLGGIGHFYLNKFKQGFVFLIVGSLLEISIPLTAFSSILDKPQIDSQTMFSVIDNNVLILLGIFGIVTIIHMLFITRNET